MRLLLALPFFSVFVQIGFSASFPELRALYDSSLWAGSFLGAAPLGVLIAGPLHGLATRRWGTRRVLTASLLGWAATSGLLAITVGVAPLAVVLRFVLGLCDASLSITPMVLATTALRNERERARYYGAFETAASAGAISGPLAVGGLMLYSPSIALAALAVVAALFAVVIAPRTPNIASEEGGASSLHIPRTMVMPVLFGVATILVLVAIETALPDVVVDRFGLPVAGKAAVTLFELVAVGGVIVKSRIPGTYPWILPLLTVVLAAAFFVGGSPALLVILYVAAAFLIGLCLTMSNEYAATVATGSEESAMSVYASFKVSGGFFGPYIAALGAPTLFLPLAALTLVTGGLVALHRTRM